VGTSEFAGRLQRARLSQGMTVRGLARRTGYSPAQISKVENGKARASAAFARLCDAALGMDGELLKAVAREEGNAGEPVPSERYQGWHLSLTLGGNSELHPLGDRQGPPLMRFAAPAVEQQVPGVRRRQHALDAVAQVAVPHRRVQPRAQVRQEHQVRVVTGHQALRPHERRPAQRRQRHERRHRLLVSAVITAVGGDAGVVVFGRVDAALQRPDVVAGEVERPARQAEALAEVVVRHGAGLLAHTVTHKQEVP